MGITTTVQDVMTRDIISIETGDSVKRAIEIMVKRNIGSVVITERGKPVGIITERDIMKNVCPNELCVKGVNAAKIMSSPLFVVQANARLGEAVLLMMEKQVRRLLVEDSGKMVGIVTQKDLLKGTLDTFAALAMV